MRDGRSEQGPGGGGGGTCRHHQSIGPTAVHSGFKHGVTEHGALS